VRLPAGNFLMGSTAADILDAIRLCQREQRGSLCEKLSSLQAEGVAHEVYVDGFFLDRTEVSLGAYRRCVTAGACAPAATPPGDPRFDHPDLPVTWVRWEDAHAYCEWRGGRLPTEAEWEYAARGPTGRIFPWGKHYNPFVANHGAFADDETDGSDGYAFLAPVDAFPDGATPEGILNLGGNAAEWVADFWGDVDDAGNGYPRKSQVNPKGPSQGVFRVIRGGGYVDGPHFLRGAARRMLVLGRASFVGFRCAWDGPSRGGTGSRYDGPR
jgi:formylglycine-generating enzyme required for sulfatase activity